MSIADEVLAFYQECPFNTYSDPKVAARSILSANQIQLAYGDLDTLLNQSDINSLLDVGCGGGWFVLSASYFYKILAKGIDFNAKVIALAREVAEEAQVKADFEVFDIFSNGDPGKFDIVCSLGVLHHTADPRRGISILSNFLSQNSSARLYIGLYHTYGRRPFLKIFEEMKERGESEERLFMKFCELHSTLVDKQHLVSWFRDQVLHPHESQHTLMEVNEILNEIGLEIESTSLNKYEKFVTIDDIMKVEYQMEELSYTRNVKENKYFPGFFTVCAKRKEIR